MRIIDTHSHLYGEEFAEDIAEVVARARASSVDKILLPNINEASIESMMKLCRRWSDCFHPMIGLHPTDVNSEYDAALRRMESLLAKENDFVAVGEVGLDYYWDSTYYIEQQVAFSKQVEWSIKYELPLMIHTRSAHKEMVEILSRYKGDGITGVFHSFGGTEDEVEELLDFTGFMIGINGVVTFKNSKLSSVLVQVPLERVVLETDAPYLTPVPFRGCRNESSYIFHTLKKVAEIYGLSPEFVAEQTYRNAMKIFTKLR